MLRLVTLQ
jgi:AcrR family transcriptional regulator